jgi:L-asparaginase II
MLEKIGVSPDALHCGVHEPYSPEAAAVLRAHDEVPTALHNNCSGKHAGMLAVAVHLGAPIENYESAENPVQIAIARASFANLPTVPLEDMAVGIDGCGRADLRS